MLALAILPLLSVDRFIIYGEVVCTCMLLSAAVCKPKSQTTTRTEAAFTSVLRFIYAFLSCFGSFLHHKKLKQLMVGETNQDAAPQVR